MMAYIRKKKIKGYTYYYLVEGVYEEKNKPKVIAEQIRKQLGDEPKNLNFHLKMAKNYKAEILFECLSIALDAQRNKMINTSLPKYYVGILRRKGLLSKNKNYG